MLLVEDNDEVRSLVAKLLGSLKLEVLEAANGDEAERLMVEPLDLLVSDVMLPGVAKGPDIARTLRAIQPGIAVLYMSGFHPGVLSQEDLAQKGVDFIQKPFSRDDFSSKIEMLLHNSIKAQSSGTRSADRPGEQARRSALSPAAGSSPKEVESN